MVVMLCIACVFVAILMGCLLKFRIERLLRKRKFSRRLEIVIRG